MTGGSYVVARHDPSSGLYTVWSVDSNGNYLSNIIGAVAGTSTALESLETTFNQDLNGDGHIGPPPPPPPVVIQTDGSTSLVQAGSDYFLDPVGGETGPELQRGGTPVTVGEYGTWAPIGAVQVAGGNYDVAWHDPSSGQYTVWTVDANGNYLSNLIPAVSGTSTALESLETTFNQDLNGDGTIGIPKVVIQTDGSTSLVQVGSNYFLYPVGGSSGPELTYAGAAVTVGEFGGWTPIGGELTSTGYDVAWKDTATNQYTVWSTNNTGNYTSNIIGAVAGTSTALEALDSRTLTATASSAFTLHPALRCRSAVPCLAHQDQQRLGPALRSNLLRPTPHRLRSVAPREC